MTRSHLYAITIVCIGLIGALLVAFLPPVPVASTDGQARRTCREEGFRKPAGDDYAYCLAQATKYIEWGEPALARAFARAAAEAREACLREGMQPASPGLKTCIEHRT